MLRLAVVSVLVCVPKHIYCLCSLSVCLFVTSSFAGSTSLHANETAKLCMKYCGARRWSLEQSSRISPLLVCSNMALVGGLVLLLAEASTEAKTMFAGIPSMGGNQKQSYLQLTGRLLVIFMFLTLFRLELSVFRLIELLIGSVLVVCVGIGYKTKLSALVLVSWLTLTNFLLNAFWLIPANRIMRDFMKYDFFQTFSVIGGLLFVVALGPGGVSLDEHKKDW